MLFLAYVFNFVDRQILSILLQPIKAELQVSDTAMGFLTGMAFALFYTFAGLPIARWADYGTRRTIIALGIAIWSVMTAASGFARNFVQLALARVGVGVGEATLSPAAHSLISDYFPPERRATALAIYSMGASFGILLGLAAGGWLRETLGWRAAFLIVGLPGLAVALLTRLTVREPPRGHVEGLSAETHGESLGEVLAYLWRLRSFRHLSLAASLYGFAGYGFSIWAPAFLERSHQMSATEVGFWLGPILGLGGALGTYLGGRLGDHLGAKDARWYMRLAAIGACLQLPFALAFLLWPDAGPALAFLIPSTVLSLFYVAPTYAMTQGLAKLRMRALATAVLLFVLNLVGLGLGPQVVGILSDLLSPRLGTDSLRYALLIVVLTNLWAAGHSLVAARWLREDLAAKELA